MQPLIENIYESAIELSPWSTFLTVLRQVYGAQATTLILDMPGEASSGLHFSANADAVYERKFVRQFSNTLFVDIPINKAMTIDELVERKRLVKTSVYKELLEPANTEYILGMNIPFVHGKDALVRISRSKEQGHFSEADKLYLEMLAPHLQRALPIFFRVHQLTTEREVFGEALDQLHIGAILLDRNGCYLHANGAGQAVLKQEAGLAVRDGKVVATEAQQAQRFASLIGEGIAAYDRFDHAHCGMLLMDVGAEKRLQVLLRPSSHHLTLEVNHPPAICLFISSTGDFHIPSTDVIRGLFGFTRTEGAIVAELLLGKTPKEIAGELDSSLATVRTHIKSIFLKAGVRRQADLLVAILRSVAPLA